MELVAAIASTAAVTATGVVTLLDWRLAKFKDKLFKEFDERYVQIGHVVDFDKRYVLRVECQLVQDKRNEQIGDLKTRLKGDFD